MIARKEDGSWSPPSGILLHTAGLGFLVGVDIYDCVIVINSLEALEGFTKVRCTLGSEVSVVAGPVGVGGVLESEVHKRQSPIFTYLKSRGFYAGVQIDGTVIIERTDENERFYGQKIGVSDILSGKVRHPPYEVRRLLETIKAAQGDTDVDEDLLPTEPPPGDYEIDDGSVFGVPDKEDPDPYGVLALEKEGMGIKEAHTQKRASWEAFSFNPAPTSPIHTIYPRNSIDTPRSPSRRNSWRTSTMSNDARTPSSLRTSMEFPPPPIHASRATPKQSTPKQMSDSGTQTDDLPDPPSPNRWSMRSAGGHSRNVSAFSTPHMQEVPEDKILDTSPERREGEAEAGRVNGYSTPPRTPELRQQDAHDVEDEEAHIEEPVVQSVQTVQSIQPASPQVISKVRLVDVPKRLPPRLPPRNPNRSGPMIIDASPKGEATDDAEIESKHDSAHEPAVEQSEAVKPVQEQMDDVRLDDDADDEDDLDRPDPWAKVAETKRHNEEEQKLAEETAAIKLGESEDKRAEDTTTPIVMPGSFQ